MKYGLIILILVSFSCGEPAPKTGAANNANNTNNVNNLNNLNNVDQELLNWCAANTQEVFCERVRDNAEISLNIEPGCGDFAKPECGVTPEILQTCIDAIVACDQTGTIEERFSEACLNDALTCTWSNNSNNTNNVTNNTNNANNTNNTNNVEPSAEFLAVASLWTQTCASIACHGAASTSVITAAANENATPAEVYAALMTNTPTASGLRAIEPFDPARSEVIVRMSLEPSGDLREMPQGTGSSIEDIDVFTAWINAGADF